MPWKRLESRSTSEVFPTPMGPSIATCRSGHRLRRGSPSRAILTRCPARDRRVMTRATPTVRRTPGTAMPRLRRFGVRRGTSSSTASWRETPAVRCSSSAAAPDESFSRSRAKESRARAWIPPRRCWRSLGKGSPGEGAAGTRLDGGLRLRHGAVCAHLLRVSLLPAPPDGRGSARLPPGGPAASGAPGDFSRSTSLRRSSSGSRSSKSRSSKRSAGRKARARSSGSQP